MDDSREKKGGTYSSQLDQFIKPSLSKHEKLAAEAARIVLERKQEIDSALSDILILLKGPMTSANVIYLLNECQKLDALFADQETDLREYIYQAMRNQFFSDNSKKLQIDFDLAHAFHVIVNKPMTVDKPGEVVYDNNRRTLGYLVRMATYSEDVLEKKFPVKKLRQEVLSLEKKRDELNTPALQKKYQIEFQKFKESKGRGSTWMKFVEEQAKKPSTPDFGTFSQIAKLERQRKIKGDEVVRVEAARDNVVKNKKNNDVIIRLPEQFQMMENKESKPEEGMVRSSTFNLTETPDLSMNQAINAALQPKELDAKIQAHAKKLKGALTKESYTEALKEILPNLDAATKNNLANYLVLLGASKHHVLTAERHFWRSKGYSAETRSMHRVLHLLQADSKKLGLSRHTKEQEFDQKQSSENSASTLKPK